MRRLRFAICVMALACGSCGGGNPIQRGGLLQATYGAYGQPAGYYAGRAEPFGGDASGYSAWLAANQVGIDDIQNRIAEIRIGRRVPGCISEDKYTCVATLAQKLAVADRWAARDINIFAATKSDVNGKPAGGSKITFDGYAPNAKGDHIRDHTSFYLTIGSGGGVAEMIAFLPKDPTFAQTQEEYDATGAYETIWAAIAKNCSSIGPAEVAKWLQNTIKPGSQVGPRVHWSEPDQGHARTIASKPTTFCGRLFAFDATYGSYSQGFQHTDFGGMQVMIK